MERTLNPHQDQQERDDEVRLSTAYRRHTQPKPGSNGRSPPGLHPMAPRREETKSQPPVAERQLRIGPDQGGHNHHQDSRRNPLVPAPQETPTPGEVVQDQHPHRDI